MRYGHGPWPCWSAHGSTSQSRCFLSAQRVRSKCCSFLLLLQSALPGPQASPLAPGPQDHWEEVGQAKKEQN